MKNIDTISKTLCYGCTACSTVCKRKAIEFSKDEEGFLYPHVDSQQCTGCGLCLKVCPALSNVIFADSKQYFYAVKHREKKVLEKSSSGGLFTAISDIVLKKNGIVYGAIHDSNMQTVHARADNSIDRDKQCGSKYVQSNIGSIFIDINKDLLEGKYVLFVGTPCQCAGLLATVKSEFRHNLLVVDLICNGAPSPLIFQEYINYIEKKRGLKVIEHLHRPKDNGWGHVEKNIFENGDADNTSDFSQAWKKIFYSGNALRKCCYDCKFAVKDRITDITIGDFWGIERTSIDINRTNGVSLFIGNTEQGISVINEVKKYMDVKESCYEEASVKQPRLRGVCAKAEERENFWRIYREKGASYVIEKYGRCSPYIRFKHNVKKFLIKIRLWK